MRRGRPTTFERIQEYVKQSQLLDGRAISVAEIMIEFGLSRLEVFREIAVLERNGDIVKRGESLLLPEPKRPTWLQGGAYAGSDN